MFSKTAIKNPGMFSNLKSSILYEPWTCNFAVNDKVLKRNSRKDSRKGDRLTADWLGPYEIKEITPKGVCVLSNKDGIKLKTKTNS